MELPRILIAGACEEITNHLSNIIADKKFEFLQITAEDNIDTLLSQEHPDLVIACSMENEIQKSLHMVQKIRQFNKIIPILFITEQSSEQIAIAALRAGVNDFYKIPVSEKSLLAGINRILQGAVTVFSSSRKSEINQMIIGESSVIKEVKDYISRVAATGSTVLITGETGTGKELAAEIIHLQSPRKNKAFIRINCSALPENLVESELFGYERGAFTGAVTPQKGKIVAAGGGDIFFDEIGDMSTYAQAKILRTIENKEVFPLGSDHAVPIDFRIITATNRDPEELIMEGKFRKDLYYRLNVARVHMPPLRERMEDVPDLVTFVIKNLNRKFGLNVEGVTDEAMELLLKYDWPGNVRELMNLLEAAFINFPQKKISPADLPKMFIRHFYTSRQIPTDEKRKILDALLENKWNKSSAAQKLNWSRMTLYRKLNKYNIVENGKPLG